MDRKLGYIDIPVLLQWAQDRDGGFALAPGHRWFSASAVDRYYAHAAGTAVVIENDIESPLSDSMPASPSMRSIESGARPRDRASLLPGPDESRERHGPLDDNRVHRDGSHHAWRSQAEATARVTA